MAQTLVFAASRLFSTPIFHDIMSSVVMQSLFYKWAWFIGLGGASLWGASPGLRYLDEIGHLASDVDARKSVTLGPARVVATGGGKMGLQGRDNNGRTWRAFLPIDAGLGYTTAWQADFDKNGRSDLLIASEFPKNGRCIDPVTLSFLLFDQNGSPMPWVIQNWTLATNRFPSVPVIFTDLDHKGRLELIVTNCEYSPPPVVGEDRSITGVYEANDTMWRLVHSGPVDAYRSLVRRKYQIHADFTRLLPTLPGEWLDRGNTFDAEIAPSRTITSVLAASPTCHGIRLFVVDGRVTKDAEDPCDVIGKNRVQLSDGTICYGWPTVLVDRADEREIVASSELTELEPLLREIAEKHFPVVLAGQKEPGHCSPSLLWARAPH